MSSFLKRLNLLKVFQKHESTGNVKHKESLGLGGNSVRKNPTGMSGEAKSEVRESSLLAWRNGVCIQATLRFLYFHHHHR